MSESSPNPLGLTQTILKVLMKLNLLFGFLVLVMLIASLVAEEWMMHALGASHPNQVESNAMLVMGMRTIMIIGILAVPFTQAVLKRLLEIVETVKMGDPFVMVNADRLQTIAWSVLGLQLMHLVVGAVARFVSSVAHPLDIGWKFTITPWLVVLLCFVLARVFEQGARMREELEGTV